MPQHLIDPAVGKAPTNFENMGFTPQEIAALSKDVDPSKMLDEYQQHDSKESSWMEKQHLDRIKQESDQLRSQLGQSQEQVQQLRTEQANISGQLQAMQNAQVTAQQQAQLDAQYGLTQEEIDNHGELLPLVNKLVGKSAAQLQAEYDAKLERETQAVRQQLTEQTQQELDALKAQQAQVMQQNEAQNAAQLNTKIRDLGLGDMSSLVQNPEFLKRHGSPVYPGSTVAWGDELTRHIKEGNIASAEMMLEDFRNNSETFQPREDTVVPTSRRPATQAPMSTAQSANLQKRDKLVQIYQQRMEDANNGTFPQGMNRAQYRQAQTDLLSEIDKIPTT